ncbi:hypothetical protein Tsubulata_015751 [Turnera subulata]|uniref:Uncharacterized protein n=1 Tax=Turnera subulata TaxID=218843 RepID=A0A9Q0JLF6_9ROSI|nr:hypothetical protein Tsubulata_015751 [Turnera subulata]
MDDKTKKAKQEEFLEYLKMSYLGKEVKKKALTLSLSQVGRNEEERRRERVEVEDDEERRREKIEVDDEERRGD